VNIINLLTAKGFVYRENNPNDRRQQLLRVTEKAKLAVPQIIETFENINADITEGISETDMQVFESVLTRMHKNLNPLISPETTLQAKSHTD
jgi:MarR family transcriptional regulator for hemolysin